MGMPETMGEYLVKLSADIDTNSFNAAMAAMNQLMSALKKVKGLAVAAAAVSGFAAIGKAAVSIVKSVAAADMEFKRLATQMWITKDSAKALSTAMKVMGVSQEDLAWVPELREQFFRLRNEIAELSTPKDADSQLKWIREIGYDIQSLQVKLKMLKEWIAYYLIKYLKPFIKEFQDFIQWLGDKLGKNMPQIAKKIAEFLGHVVSVGLSAIKVLKMVIGGIYRFIDGMPANVKKWGAIFAMVGAFIMASPFGRLIAVLGGVMLLMEDFIYYMNGWNSSKALAPMWEKLLRFIEGDALADFTSNVTDLLDRISSGLDYIVTNFIAGVDWEGVFDTWNEGVSDLASGVNDLFEAISKLFGRLEDSTGSEAKQKQKSFWSSIGTFVSDSLKEMGKLVGLVGKLIGAIALCLRGDFSGAASMLGTVIKGVAGMSPMAKLAGMLFSSDDEKERSNTVIAELMKAGMSKNGAAGLVGNLSAESGVDSTRAQGEFGAGIGKYLARIRNGEIDRDTFINDGVGFGLAQWTDEKRKGALWDYAQSRGADIGDMGLQLEFLLNELRTNYKDVYEKLCRGDISIREASDAVLHGFERPEDQSELVERVRAGYGEAAYRNAPENPVHGGSGGKFAVDPSSYAATAAKGNSLVSTAAYMGGNSNTSNVNSNIVVNVNGNGDANEIAQRVDDVVTTRFGRGCIV
jgi:hypothetical protein